MKKINLQNTLLLSILVCSQVFAFGQNRVETNPWKKTAASSLLFRSADRQIFPNTYELFELDLNELKALMDFSSSSNSDFRNNQSAVLSLPNPEGLLERFAIKRTDVLHPDLGKKYPGIYSFSGRGISNPEASLKFDLGPNGFHGMVLESTRSYFIDPYVKTNNETYMVYDKKSLNEPNDIFQCELGELKKEIEKKEDTNDASRAGDCQLRTYRLALACTGEYANYHGGTKALVLAAMNTAMTRVNGIYERDFAVTMQIIPENDTLIFLNSSTDPYTNNNGQTMLGENQTTVDNRIGTLNYDIGHVFSTGGGGIASLESVCRSGRKARGVTGRGAPIGDAFTVDYVAHEMGHQFGANHTQNNSCNRVAGASVEPGSASTIMGYAGICNPDVQQNSDDYFHAYSIQEISTFITTGTGNTCPVKTDTGNDGPVSSVGTSKTLPISTPFVLTGAATDDGDPNALTYTWEQMDSDYANMPPEETSKLGPLFRSISPTASPSRYFPNLNDLVNNVTPTWEVLPAVSRNMEFRFTVRDNYAGAGCTDEADLSLTFTEDAGPFNVLMPNLSESVFVGDLYNVVWDVANTDMAPVSCANVDILLSTDGGLTYPITIVSDVANDGSHEIMIPNEVTTEARIMVRCSDNYFFDISNNNFTIELPPFPTFIIGTTVNEITVCGTDDAIYNFNISTLLSFDEAITFSVRGLPSSAQYSFSSNPMVPPGALVLSITDLENVANGKYNLEVIGNAMSEQDTFGIILNVFNGVPVQPVLANPTNSEQDVPVDATLSWNFDTQVEMYTVELASNPAFGQSIIETKTVNSGAVNFDNLASFTIYYWRVKGQNPCGDGQYSETYAFRTVEQGCTSYHSNDTPVNIPSNQSGTYSSNVFVPMAFPILDVNLLVNINHTWIGDLDASLVSPSGIEIALFDRPGIPSSGFGCGQNNISVIFDDAATNTADDFENTCNSSGAYAISGVYQTIDPLSSYENTLSNGSWELKVRDNASQDGGNIVSWAIEVCRALESPQAPDLIKNNDLYLLVGASAQILNTNLQSVTSGNSSSQIIYQLRSLPSNGALSVGGTPLGLGSTFSQAEIDAGSLNYEHTGSANDMNDSFDFDVFNQEDGWLPENTFNINLLSMSVAVIIDNPIDCHNANNAQISVDVTGGAPNFQYSLDGINYQQNNVFSGLGSGDYTVKVKDANGFEIESSLFSLTNPEPIDVNTSVTNDEITVTASGGTGTLTYSIDGTNFQSNNVFSGVANGSYTVTVKDENDCTSTANAIVAVNTLIVSAEVVEDISCFDESDGVIIANVGGGSSPYQYRLIGGTYQSSNRFENLSPGNYSIQVKDAMDFEQTTNVVGLNNPRQIIVTTTVDDNMVTINASGGTGMLRYSIDGINFKSDNVFTGLSNGGYTATVLDDNGCIETTSFSISYLPLIIENITVNHVSCFGGIDGSIIIEISGGTPNYFYKLNGGSIQVSNEFNGLNAGNYIITISDAAGSVLNTSTIVITEPDLLVLNSNTSDYSVELSASGGTMPYEYSLDGINYSADTFFDNLASGDYIGYVKDANGCIQQDTFTISVAPLAISVTQTENILCFGDETGEVTLSASGGIPPYEYKIDDEPFQSSNVFGNLSGGFYTFTLKDSGGFETNQQHLVTQPSLMNLYVIHNVDSLVLNTTGGTPTYEYSIDSGSNWQANNTFYGLTQGHYDIVVRDSNDCQIDSTVFVDTTVSVFDLSNELYFEITPNPTHGIFKLECKLTSNSPLTVEVYDLNGKRVFTQNVESQGNQLLQQIDLGFVQAGMYQIVVSNGNQIGQGRLVVIK